MASADKKAWWRESRFGMFIHWGLYSQMARGEWVMFHERIPVGEYEKLAEEFNPVKFDADEWVRLAKNAGMNYIVITAKHHDGFSMFKTEVDSYNIVDSTPYGRDVMIDLARACEREGIKLGFYYSHVREWRHPHAQSLEMKGPNLLGNYGNFWDHREENRKNLQYYLDEFDKPQLKELLSQYGPIGIIWFDTPSLIRPDQAQELVDLIRELQPDCLVNSRVSDDDEVDYDYLSLGDCEIPGIPAAADWETPMTICTAWGYYNLPGNEYRSPEELVRQLVDIVSLGGNYLLNVGPTGEGVIPEEAQERLRAIGQWMAVHGEAIYGTQASPFEKSPQWGRITRKDSRLFLFVYDWQHSVNLYGLNNRVKKCHLLSNPSVQMACKQTRDETLEFERLEIDLPDITPDSYCTVLVLEIEGEPDVDQTIIQEESGVIQLTAIQASIHQVTEGRPIKVARSGATENWLSPDDWLSWDYIAIRPGEYDVRLLMNTGYSDQQWDYEHEMEITINSQSLTCRIGEENRVNPGQPIDRIAGRVCLDGSAQYRAELKAKSIGRRNLKGLTFLSLQLIPVK